MHDNQNILLILAAVAAGALLIQTIFMVVFALTALKAIKAAREEMDEFRSAVIPVIEKIRPIVEKTQRIVDQVAPRVEEIGGHLSGITKSLREQTADIQVTTHDILDRTRRQASRVDGIMSSVLNRVERAGEVVSDAVAKPMRQLSGLIASIKAAVEVLREQPQPASPPAPRVVATRYPEGERYPTPRPTGTTTQFQP
jgi:methyl-accepting chemotaxis protein